MAFTWLNAVRGIVMAMHGARHAIALDGADARLRVRAVDRDGRATIGSTPVTLR